MKLAIEIGFAVLFMLGGAAVGIAVLPYLAGVPEQQIKHDTVASTLAVGATLLSIGLIGMVVARFWPEPYQETEQKTVIGKPPVSRTPTTSRQPRDPQGPPPGWHGSRQDWDDLQGRRR